MPLRSNIPRSPNSWGISWNITDNVTKMPISFEIRKADAITTPSIAL
jgi:hypothetical protein